MTADSDDVADSADKKPKGSLEHPPTSKPPQHATDDEQAAENRDDDPPA